MNPILYPANETTFTSNGLGVLSDAISCAVTEEINSKFELVLKYPVTGLHYSDIDYIKSKNNGTWSATQSMEVTA